jgi:hypothetical protein
MDRVAKPFRSMGIASFLMEKTPKTHGSILPENELGAANRSLAISL